MVKTNFLLHYPDGDVTRFVREDLKPDAFLWKTNSIQGYLVALNLTFKAKTFAQAVNEASHTKISEQSCRLFPIFPLWKFLGQIDEINMLRGQLGLDAFPRGKYWTARVPNLNYHMGFSVLKGAIKSFHSDGEDTLAFAIPVIFIHDTRCLAIKTSPEPNNIMPKTPKSPMIQVPQTC